jgi:alkanesulfonate monooxygenase SsuD/methylene tetrahydromethanopterin reductase-like flavin-dependent oxidoreductase (luciferase family)
VWIAAFGPRMLRLTARWADGFITAWHTDPAEVDKAFSALDDACREVGRDPASLKRATGTFVSFDPSASARTLGGSPNQIADGLRALADAGAAHITCMLTPADQRGVEQFGRVIEQLR